MTTAWHMKGELVLNCNCDVFCPCVVSLGKHAPTQGYCQGWVGIHITDGAYGDASLTDLNVGMLLDIPGRMGNGNWTAALYVDERASASAVSAFEQIFSGQAGGTTGLFRLLVSTHLGTKKAPISITREGSVRHVTIGNILKASVEPIMGKRSGQTTMIQNTEYWMGPDVTVARSIKSKLRDFGRVWDLSGKSAEIVDIDWSGP
jgi:hypothetical protein